MKLMQNANYLTDANYWKAFNDTFKHQHLNIKANFQYGKVPKIQSKSFKSKVTKIIKCTPLIKLSVCN